MLLLRKKPEPQPTIEPSAPPNSPDNSTQIAASAKADAPSAAPASIAEATLPKTPVAEKTASTEPSAKKERRLLIAEGISFRGEITGCDRLVIDGALDGEIKACRHIAISDGGTFKGIAVVEDADIAGSCAGSLTVREKLFLSRSARVFGSVRYGRLSIEEGGELDGDLRRLTDDGVAELPLVMATVPPVKAPASEKITVENSQPAPAAESPAERVTRDFAEIERLFAAGLSARDLSRFDEAEALFKSVVAKSPDHAAALANLGKLARQRGDRAAMREYYEAALAVESANLTLRVEIARAFKEQGDIALAREILEAALTGHGGERSFASN